MIASYRTSLIVVLLMLNCAVRAQSKDEPCVPNKQLVTKIASKYGIPLSDLIQFSKENFKRSEEYISDSSTGESPGDVYKRNRAISTKKLKDVYGISQEEVSDLIASCKGNLDLDKYFIIKREEPGFLESFLNSYGSYLIFSFFGIFLLFRLSKKKKS